jgi:predicted transcriptional regulator
MDKIKKIGSFTWIKNAVLDNPSMSSNDIMVYLSLMRFMNNNTQECFPAIKTIMKISRLGQRSVYRSLNNLEKSGLIHSERNRGKISNYTILEPPEY